MKKIMFIVVIICFCFGVIAGTIITDSLNVTIKPTITKSIGIDEPINYYCGENFKTARIIEVDGLIDRNDIVMGVGCDSVISQISNSKGEILKDVNGTLTFNTSSIILLDYGDAPALNDLNDDVSTK